MNGPLKTCRTCRRELPPTLEHFHTHPPARDGLRGSCIDCRREEGRARYAANAEREKARMRKTYAARKHYWQQLTSPWRMPGDVPAPYREA